MLYITIHDDKLYGALKDMSVKIDDSKADRDVFNEMRESSADLVKDWWSLRKNPERVEEFYGV